MSHPIGTDPKIPTAGPRRMSYEEFLRSDYVWAEWVDGEVRRQADFFFLDGNANRPLPVDEKGIFRSRVLEGFWLAVDWLWDEPLPRLPTVVKAWGLV